MTAIIDHRLKQTHQAMPMQWAPVLPASPIELSRILEEVRQALDHDPGAARAGVDRLAEALKIAVGTNEPRPARGGLTPRQRRKVEAHIDEKLGTSIPVQVLADLVFLSASHFRRVFKETFGNSPHAHIVLRRVARAQEMMLLSREPLGQIALSCGFADQAHFSTHFRRLVGRTPSDWRRANAVLV